MMNVLAIRIGVTSFLLFVAAHIAYSQNSVLVNNAALEGVELTKKNIFNYQIINNDQKAHKVIVFGSVIYKRSSLRFSYSFNTTIYPGINQYSNVNVINPQWTFQNAALRELFFQYDKLPQGTYEYCVEVRLEATNAEFVSPDPIGSCTYNTIDDIFLINLITPENDAKIYEYYPSLGWVVNYPFASELSYSLRLAELNEGQNNEAAIVRNNPIFHDKHLFSTNIIYPVTAKPLELYQPYVWTVDAYYKGILLGGAEVWKFTIIEDTLLEELPYTNAYIDIRREYGGEPFFSIGEIKLKYVLDDIKYDSLKLKLTIGQDKEVKLPIDTWKVKYGDNRTVIKLTKGISLKHMKKYVLHVLNRDGIEYQIPFIYVNPALSEEINRK